MGWLREKLVMGSTSGLLLLVYFFLRSGRSLSQSSANICERTARSSGIRVINVIRNSDHADRYLGSVSIFPKSVSIRFSASDASVSTGFRNRINYAFEACHGGIPTTGARPCRSIKVARCDQGRDWNGMDQRASLHPHSFLLPMEHAAV